MKYLVCFLVVVLLSCGGSLTDEQRKKLKVGMELNSIKKISDVQITEAAFTMGRTVVVQIEKSNSNNLHLIDSLQKSYKIKIHKLQPGDAMLLEMEKQIVEAYTSGSGLVQLPDNVQRLGTDSLLYTKPIMKSLPDGAMQFSYALGIRMPKKQVVLSIKDE